MIVLTLKEFIEIIRCGIEVYQELADTNGLDGDYVLFDGMYKEIERVSELCKDIEDNYNLYQYIDRIHIYQLLNTKDSSLRDGLKLILDAYFHRLEKEKNDLIIKQNNITSIQGVLTSIE